MFDEANLYNNIPDEYLAGAPAPGQQHPMEARVPALPSGGGAGGIPIGGSASPDGIGTGAWSEPVYEPPPGAAIIPTGNGGYPQGADGWIEPTDTTPEAAGRSAGLTMLFVAVSAGVGYALGGWKGATSGLLLSGAVTNGYRATKNFGSTVPDQKHEAVVSSVFSAAGLGFGTFLAYKAYEASGGAQEEEEDDE